MHRPDVARCLICMLQWMIQMILSEYSCTCVVFAAILVGALAIALHLDALSSIKMARSDEATCKSFWGLAQPLWQSVSSPFVQYYENFSRNWWRIVSIVHSLRTGPVSWLLASEDSKDLQMLLLMAQDCWFKQCRPVKISAVSISSTLRLSPFANREKLLSVLGMDNGDSLTPNWQRLHSVFEVGGGFQEYGWVGISFTILIRARSKASCAILAHPLIVKEEWSCMSRNTIAGPESLEQAMKDVGPTPSILREIGTRNWPCGVDYSDWGHTSLFMLMSRGCGTTLLEWGLYSWNHTLLKPNAMCTVLAWCMMTFDKNLSPSFLLKERQIIKWRRGRKKRL